jgi:hypothetical protein
VRLFRIEFIYADNSGHVETKEFHKEEEAIDWAYLYAAESGMDRELDYSHFEVFDLFEDVTYGTFRDRQKNEYFADIYAQGHFRPQVVVAAANRSACKTVVLVGARHWDSVMHAQADALPTGAYEFPLQEQGFIDQYGNFLTREEAAMIVGQNKQPLRESIEGMRLYSENLY